MDNFLLLMLCIHSSVRVSGIEYYRACADLKGSEVGPPPFYLKNEK